MTEMSKDSKTKTYSGRKRLNENELQPFLTGERHGLPDYQVGWFNIDGAQCLMLRTGLKTYKGEDVCYKIAEYLPNQ